MAAFGNEVKLLGLAGEIEQAFALRIWNYEIIPAISYQQRHVDFRNLAVAFKAVTGQELRGEKGKAECAMRVIDI